MAEILSQSQVDALLNSVQTGMYGSQQSAGDEGGKSTYRKYDFYSPKKFTKDKLKMLQGIYENYARIVSSRLNAILRVNSEIEVEDVQEQRYHEFSNTLTDNDIIMLSEWQLQNDSQNPPIILHIQQILMVNMIDRMLGGMGNDDSIKATYTYTDIELGLYRKVMGYMIDATQDAWSNYIDIELGDEILEENPSLFQDISMDEAVAVVTLKVTLDQIDGKLGICIPGNLLTEIFSIIDKRKNINSEHANDAQQTREAILSRIKESALTVRAELGDAQVSLKDVYGLKVGDVLDLNKPKDTPVSLYVNQDMWFSGQPGIHNKNVAVKLQNRLDQESDDRLQRQEFSNMPEPEQTKIDE